MKIKNVLKRVMICTIISSMLLPNSLVFADEADKVEDGIYKEDVKLKDNDEIEANDTLLWKKNVTVSGEEIEINLPENLIFSEKKAAYLTDIKGNVISADINITDGKVFIENIKNDINVNEPETPIVPEEVIKPIEPETPVTPEEPVKPTEPETPVTPEEPVKPTEPETPVTPEEPVKPTEPETPVTPEEPVKPIEPETPVTPEEPVKPIEPETPVTPEEPVKPTEPETPVEPVNTENNGEGLSSSVAIFKMDKLLSSKDNTDVKVLTKTADYILTVPFIIDKAAVADDDTIMIDGIKLRIKIPVLLDTKVSGELTDCTAELYKEADIDDQGFPKEGTSAIASGSTLKVDEKLVLRIYRDNLADINAGVKYTIPLPDAIGTPSADNTGEPLKVTIEGVTKEFATLSWKQGDNFLSIEFKEFDPVNGITLYMLQDVYLNFHCTLDNNKNNADDQGRLEIDLPGNKKLTITVSDWVPKGAELKKEVKNITQNQNSSETEWTVTYTHPTDAYTGEKPDQLIDILPEGLEYIDQSVTISVNDVNAGVSDFDYDAANRKITYSLNSIKSGDKVIIKYRTKLTGFKISELWGNTNKIELKNSIKGVNTAYPNGIDGLSASATLTIPKNWIGFNQFAKDGALRYDENTNKWKIDWTIKVDTLSRNFKYLYVLDTIGKGLILDTTTIKLNNSSLPSKAPSQLPPYYMSSPNTGGKGTDIKIVLIDSSSTEQASSSYTITYTTEINPGYFEHDGSFTEEDVKNSAQLQYKWPDGNYPGGELTTPVINKGPGNIDNLGNDLIKKSNTGYNYSEHSLTWNIEVNPYKVNLTEAVIEDDLTDSNHLFVLDTNNTNEINKVKDEIKQSVISGLKNIGLNENNLKQVLLEGNKLRVELVNIGKNTFSFSVKTYSADPEKWANNTEKVRYSNTAVMLKDVTKIASNPITENKSSTASKEVTTNILKKTSTKYDPKTKKITWKLEINKDKVQLGEVDITDILSEGLSCEDDDIANATINGAAFSGNNSFTVDKSSNATPTVKIHLFDVKDVVTVEFTTTVNVDTASFHKDKTIQFSNEAKLNSSSYSGDVTSNTNISLDNTIIKKDAIRPNLSNNKNTVEYTVKLNPNGINLLEGMAGRKLYITDKLDDGLYLDLESVKIYDASPTSSLKNGKWELDLTKNTELSPRPDISYNSKENSFSLEIPDASKSYIITYTAYVVRTGVELNNNVSLSGSIIPENSDNNRANMSFRMNAVGGASFSLPSNKFLSLEIKKVDKNGSKLEGASFGLYADKKGDPIVTATCDSSTGICTLAIPVSEIKGDKLYWKELTAPQGYSLNGEWHEINVNPLPSDTIKVNMINVKDDEATQGMIKIIKTDGAQPLTGAKFALYEDEELTVIVKGETEVAADGTLTFDNLYPTKNYWLKETQAPDKYVILDKPIKIEAKIPSEAIQQNIANEKDNVTLDITKVDEGDNNIKLDDTGFELYVDEACTNKIDTMQLTDNNGNCKFINLKPYTTYYLKEVKPKDGYISNNSVFTIKTENNNETIIRQFSNHQQGWNEKAIIEIIKTDTEGINKLKGARFALYLQDKQTIVAEEETDNNGICTFDELKQGTYYVKEVKAPAGYELATEWVEVNVRMNTKESVSIVNNPVGWNTKASIEITKTDAESKEKLSGAHFSLYSQDKVTLLAEEITDSNGICLFENLKEGIYHIKEVKAPAGYELATEWVEVNVRMNTKASVSIINNPVGWNTKASLQITKTNEKGDTKLKAAVFELYKEDQKSLVGELTTNDEGICIFTNLLEGKYYLKEKQAPEGYVLNKEWIEVNVRMNSAETITVKNSLVSHNSSNGNSGSAGSDSDSTSNRSWIGTIVEGLEKEPDNSSIPRTGVRDYTVIWFIGLVMAIASAVVLCIFQVRQNKQNKKSKRR